MYVTNICTINGDTYSIRRDVDRSKYTLWKNKEVIAAIIRIEYDNWKGHQIKFRPYENDKIKVTKKGKIKTTKIGYFFDCKKIV